MYLFYISGFCFCYVYKVKHDRVNVEKVKSDKEWREVDVGNASVFTDTVIMHYVSIGITYYKVYL